LGVAPRYPEELSLLRTISDLFIPGIRVFSLGLELCNLQSKHFLVFVIFKIML